MNIPFRNKATTGEQKANIISDYLAGMTFAVIAKRNKVSVRTAKRVIEKAREEK